MERLHRKYNRRVERDAAALYYSEGANNNSSDVKLRDAQATEAVNEEPWWDQGESGEWWW